MRRTSLAVSVAMHGILAAFLFSITFPQTAARIRYITPIFMPETHAAPPPPRPRTILKAPPALRPLAIRPLLQAPSVLVSVPAAPEIALAPAPVPVPAPAPPPVAAGPTPLPAPTAPAPAPVRVGSFAVAAAAPVEKPALPVQPQIASAGFNGPAEAVPNRAGRAVAATGAFGSAAAAPQSAARQQVASARFDTAVVKPPSAPANARPVESSRFTPLEILDKPRPAYSAEARRLQIEGEVVLEALFSANGRIRVMRVMRSLGHGLDENAIQAAAGIRFRPATENGSPRDMVAVVRIAFQLAY